MLVMLQDRTCGFHQSAKAFSQSTSPLLCESRRTCPIYPFKDVHHKVAPLRISARLPQMQIYKGHHAYGTGWELHLSTIEDKNWSLSTRIINKISRRAVLPALRAQSRLASSEWKIRSTCKCGAMAEKMTSFGFFMRNWLFSAFIRNMEERTLVGED